MVMEYTTKPHWATIVFLMLLMRCQAVLFDFHVIESRQSFLDGEQLCKDQGYDGLGVISSPEMYELALRLTEPHRTGVDGSAVYVGMRYHANREAGLWDDGTVPASDTPWKSGNADAASTIDPYGMMAMSGELKWTSGSSLKLAICGNHGQRFEAHGTTLSGQQAANVTWSLAWVSVSTSLECALYCGQDSRCRVAEFNSEKKSCRTLAAGAYSSFVQSSTTQTFVRTGFQ
ncbi:hypothetical protein EGW08_022458 [Elysia chlorotica]|uniref:Apple domain-containing protein n=1 Tax=Elysia chlorotica TaxID=188477 RepID=A0A3S1H0H3_ELYCH|nr:hypothetical protein EGW08_022458 [Elysia chlorotica]